MFFSTIPNPNSLFPRSFFKKDLELRKYLLKFVD